MTLPGPLVIILLPLGMAVLAWLMRRWSGLAVLLTSLSAAMLAWLVARASLDNPTSFAGMTLIFHEPYLVLGRALALTATTRWPIVWLFAAVALSHLIIAPTAPRSQLFGFSLGITALLVAALLATQIIYTALLLVTACLLTIFPLQETSRRTRGGLHYIAYVVLALPALLLTQALLEQYTITPTSTNLLTTARGLLFVAFAMLLGAFPFQAWISNLTRDGAPRTFPLVFTVNLGAVWFMLLAYLETYPWLNEGPFFQVWPNLLGLVMVLTSGIMAAAHQRLSRMTGYLLLGEQGLWFIALGLRGTDSLSLALGLLLARPLALGLLSLGLEGLRAAGEGDDTLEAMTGLGWRAPWATAAFILGVWALLGLPLSFNFVARWGLYDLWAQKTALPAALLLAGAAGGFVGLGRALQVLFAAARHDAPANCPMTQRVAVALWGVLLLLLGLFPQPLLRLAETIAQHYTFWMP